MPGVPSDLGHHVGEHGEERVDVRLGGVAGERDPHVAVGQHAHGREHVAGLQRRGGAGRAAGDLEAAPVERVHDRLAVDVEEREGDQVGEPVDRVADHLGVRDGGDRGPDPVDQRALAAVDLVALGHDRLERGRRGQGGRDVLEAGHPLVDPVVVGEGVGPADALAHQQDADPGRPAPLVGGAGGHRPAVGQGEPAHRGAGVHEARHAGASTATGWTVPTSWLACWSATTSGCAQVGRGRPGPSASTRHRPRPPTSDRQARACRTAECSTAECATSRAGAGPGPAAPGARRRSRRTVNDTSSRRTPSASATASRALSRISLALRAGPCRRRGSAYPWSSAARKRVPGRRVQRLRRRGVQVHPRKLPFRGTPPGGFPERHLV